MSFPAYPMYKNSGVDWLGKVPEHWEVQQLRYVAELNPSKSEIAAIDKETMISFLPMDAIGEDGTLRLEQQRAIAEVESGYTYFRDGDVVVAKITPCFENGKGAVMSGLTNGVGFGTTELTVVRPRPGASTAAYLHMLVHSGPFRQLGESHMYGAGGQKRVPDAFVENFTTAFPPVPEQCTIAHFLTNETAKIDALIAEQRRLIELLQEKRQAVISHAVTKGLNPDAPMKPSGVEWIGGLPAHWEVKRLRHFAEVLRGKFTHRPRNDPAYYDGVFPFIQTGDITGATRYITNHTQTLNEQGAAVSKEFPKGTLVMAIAANIGDVAILDFPAYFPDSVVGLVPRGTVDLLYLYVLMRAMKQPMEMAATASTQMNLNVDQISSLLAPCPPSDEQAAIVSYLNQQLEQADTLTLEAERAIRLLQERGTALISAAVTGKIDVRGYAVADAA